MVLPLLHPVGDFWLLEVSLGYLSSCPRISPSSHSGSIQTCTSDITHASPQWFMQADQTEEGTQDLACTVASNPSSLLGPIHPPSSFFSPPCSIQHPHWPSPTPFRLHAMFTHSSALPACMERVWLSRCSADSLHCLRCTILLCFCCIQHQQNTRSSDTALVRIGLLNFQLNPLLHFHPLVSVYVFMNVG